MSTAWGDQCQAPDLFVLSQTCSAGPSAKVNGHSRSGCTTTPLVSEHHPWVQGPGTQISPQAQKVSAALLEEAEMMWYQRGTAGTEALRMLSVALSIAVLLAAEGCGAEDTVHQDCSE